MGALHSGHLSLINEALKENEIVICSVFVNPTQFNNAEDLRVYPRNIEADGKVLENAGCSILFAPSIDEMYPESQDVSDLDQGFGKLTKVMEAVYRPGHFNGVIAIVKRLFEVVKPTKAYFGEKDFQQLCIVRKLVEVFNFNIQIVGCPIIREEDGLAMSSRNMNLSIQERNSAVLIHQVLFDAVEMYKLNSLDTTRNWVQQQFKNEKLLTFEYFEICEESSLEKVEIYNDLKKTRAFIVVYAGNTRLIDNAPIN